ncbi:MAG: tetratricopeptide repeat protein [Nitrospirae bacterium]|nr:tetratricopeptide repeat protein [Candidatus Manganitrophaceae bacterium]
MRSLRAALLVFFVIGSAGCGTMPRIVILNDPLSAEEHLQLGLSYEAHHEWDQALSEYRKALEKGGPSSVILGYLGNVYYAKKDYPAAEEAYQKSLHGNPQNAPVLNNLASLYLIKQKELVEAERLVQRAIAADPTRKPYYLDTLGEIYLARAEYDLAFAAYREATQLAAADPALQQQMQERQRSVLELLDRNETAGSTK